MAGDAKSAEEIIAAFREAEVRIAQGRDGGQDLPASGFTWSSNPTCRSGLGLRNHHGNSGELDW